MYRVAGQVFVSYTYTSFQTAKSMKVGGNLDMGIYIYLKSLINTYT